MRNKLIFSAKTFFLLFVLSLGLTTIQAQSLIINGNVTEATTGEPLPGVTIIEVGTSNGTVSDIDGNYRISVRNTAGSLAYSFIGYQTQQVAINGQSIINVQMQEDVSILDEVVVVAYGTVKKSDLTGSVSSISGEELTSIPAASPVQALQGKVSGVRVVSNSGAPGDAPTVRIRGIGTFGDASPIFVVDGVIVQDITFLNTSDIASMEVLKDASATSLYGSRGANGVILVTTKSGSVDGRTTINISGEYGIQRIPKYIDMLEAREFAEVMNAIQPGTFNNLNLLENTDWQRAVYEDYAPMQNYQLSITGGAEKMGYYVAAGYFNQEGIIPKSGYERLSIKINNFYKPAEFIKFGHNLNFSSFQQDHAANVVASALRAWPTDPIYDSDGNFFGNKGNGNPLASIAYNNSFREGLRMVGNFYGEATFLQDFTFRSSYGLDLEYANNQSFTPIFFVTPQQQNNTTKLTKGQSRIENWLWENTLTYNKTFGDHRLDALVGYTSQEDNYENFGASAENLLRDFITYIPGNLENLISVNNNAGIESRVSYLFRANYVAHDKYLLTLSLRRDGSSRFADANRWGNFPSVAVGWNVSEEPFFENLLNKVSSLKIRASYGIVGNDKIDVLKRFTLIEQNIGAVLGIDEVLYNGATFGTSGNPNLKWEEANQLDIGLETGFFNDKLFLELDYYRKVTNGILVPLQVPATFGNGSFAYTYFNAADVLNRGIELDLTFRGNTSEVDYTLGINGTTVHNEVLQITEGTGNTEFISTGNLGNGQNVKRIEKGYPIGYFYGYKVAGIFQNEAELTQYPALSQQGVGDFRYVDVNEDGFLTTDDRTFIGSHVPDFVFGVNASFQYKNIDLSLDFQGELGKEIYNGKNAVRAGQYNFEASALDAWDGEGSSTSEPRLSAAGVNYSPSDWFIQDGSYLRLRNLSIGYHLPESIVSNVHLTNARAYLRATNLFTVSQYSGYTPEIGGGVNISGVDTGIYPITSIYTVGLNLTF